MRSNQRSLLIDLSRDLPPRARALSSQALSQVFGGCSADRGACKTNADCCGADSACIPDPYDWRLEVQGFHCAGRGGGF
jgi:hypothetical protein